MQKRENADHKIQHTKLDMIQVSEGSKQAGYASYTAVYRKCISDFLKRNGAKAHLSSLQNFVRHGPRPKREKQENEGKYGPKSKFN